MTSYQQIVALREQLKLRQSDFWLHHVLFSWQWWAMALMTVLPWLIWAKLVDKRRYAEIVLFGSLIAIICIVLDETGTQLLWWRYPLPLLWFAVPPLIPLDLCILPVEHMLVYQYCPRWPRFLLVLVVAAFGNAFIAEPLFTWAGLYELHGWLYLYSVPVYIAKAILVRLVVEHLMKTQQQRNA